MACGIDPEPLPAERLLERAVEHHVNAMHGARREWSAIGTAAPLKFAIERVDVFSAKRLEWEMTEPRDQVVVDDALGLARGRGDQFGETASNQSVNSLATVAFEVIRRG